MSQPSAGRRARIRPTRRFSAEEVRSLRAAHELSGVSMRELAEREDVAYDTMRQLIKRTTYRWVY